LRASIAEGDEASRAVVASRSACATRTSQRLDLPGGVIKPHTRLVALITHRAKLRGEGREFLHRLLLPGPGFVQRRRGWTRVWRAGRDLRQRLRQGLLKARRSGPRGLILRLGTLQGFAEPGALARRGLGFGLRLHKHRPGLGERPLRRVLRPPARLFPLRRGLQRPLALVQGAPGLRQLPAERFTHAQGLGDLGRVAEPGLVLRGFGFGKSCLDFFDASQRAGEFGA
jgi:hypothetical protein